MNTSKPQRPQSARPVTASHNTRVAVGDGDSTLSISRRSASNKGHHPQSSGAARPSSARTRPVGFHPTIAVPESAADPGSNLSKATGVLTISTLTNSTLASIPSSTGGASAASKMRRARPSTARVRTISSSSTSSNVKAKHIEQPSQRGEKAAKRGGFADTLALEKLHSLLRTQIAVLRRVFHNVDPNRTGKADLQTVRTAIVDALYLDPTGNAATQTKIGSDGKRKPTKDSRLLSAFDELLRLADPTTSGIIEFGRFMRLLRSSSLGMFRQTTIDDENVDEEEDNELRVRFAGVTFDRRVEARLEDPRKLVKIPIGLRPSGILGDTRATKTPWAVTGDDTRLDHILHSMHREKGEKLKSCLTATSSLKKQPHPPPTQQASSTNTAAAAVGAAESASHGIPPPPPPSSRGPGTTSASGGGGSRQPRYTYRQLLGVLRSFDPFIHDAEVKQYFDACPDATPQVSHNTANKKRSFAGNRSNAFKVSGKHAHKTVDGEMFFKLFGSHVMTPPAMRNSANFTLQWDLHQERELAKPKYGSMIKQRAIEAKIHAQVLAQGGTTTMAADAVKHAQAAAAASSRGQVLTSAGADIVRDGDAVAAAIVKQHIPKPPPPRKPH